MRLNAEEVKPAPAESGHEHGNSREHQKMQKTRQRPGRCPISKLAKSPFLPSK
jgi:hypothetical protein